MNDKRRQQKYYYQRKEVMRLLKEWRLSYYFGVSEQEIYKKYREIRKIVMCD